MTSDAHPRPGGRHRRHPAGAAWQRCRTHYAVNLMAVTPKSSWPWVRTLLHSIFRPDAESVVAQYDRVLDALTDKLPKVAEHLDAARDELLAFTAFPKQIWRQIWSSTPRNDSTRRSAGAPTSSASFPTAMPSSASSARCRRTAHEWIEGRRYLGLDVLNRARATTNNPTEEQPASTPALTA